MYSFSYSETIPWNSLPYHSKEADFLRQFKHLLQRDVWCMTFTTLLSILLFRWAESNIFVVFWWQIFNCVKIRILFMVICHLSTCYVSVCSILFWCLGITKLLLLVDVFVFVIVHVDWFLKQWWQKGSELIGKFPGENLSSYDWTVCV